MTSTPYYDSSANVALSTYGSNPRIVRNTRTIDWFHIDDDVVKRYSAEEMKDHMDEWDHYLFDNAYLIVYNVIK